MSMNPRSYHMLLFGYHLVQEIAIVYHYGAIVPVMIATAVSLQLAMVIKIRQLLAFHLKRKYLQIRQQCLLIKHAVRKRINLKRMLIVVRRSV